MSVMASPPRSLPGCIMAPPSHLQRGYITSDLSHKVEMSFLLPLSCEHLCRLAVHCEAVNIRTLLSDLFLSITAALLPRAPTELQPSCMTLFPHLVPYRSNSNRYLF